MRAVLLCHQALTVYVISSGFSGCQGDSADLVKNPTDVMIISKKTCLYEDNFSHVWRKITCRSYQQSLCQWSCVFSVALVPSYQSTLLWNLRCSCTKRETLWTLIPLQLTLSALLRSIHPISWLSNIPCLSEHDLNMTLSIHLPFPRQINNSLGSSTYGLCLLFLSPLNTPSRSSLLFSSLDFSLLSFHPLSSSIPLFDW